MNHEIESRVTSFLGLCLRAGRLTTGQEACVELIRRGGAALAIAGLAAQGETVVERARLIDRGYEHLETALSHLGADIQRISAEKGEKHP